MSVLDGRPVVLALIIDARDRARLTHSLQSAGETRDVRLQFVTRISEFELVLERADVDMVMVEPTDVAGRSTEELIRTMRRDFPRIPIVGRGVMRPGSSQQLLAFARAGVHQLLVDGVDDTTLVIRHALAQARRDCAAETVLRDIAHLLPPDATIIVRWCLHHARSGPTPGDVAHALGISRRTLIHRLRHLHLSGPRALTMWTRLLLAVRYLESPGRSVEWVASAVGYPSSNAFRNVLRRYAGLPPKSLRGVGAFDRAATAFAQAIAAPRPALPPVRAGAVAPLP
jgi:AraC-like DNA-binding protein